MTEEIERNVAIDFINQVMGEFLYKEQWVMQITSKPETDDVSVDMSLKLGPLPMFYALVKTIPQVILKFRDIIKDGVEEEFVDACLRLVKEECMEVFKEVEKIDCYNHFPDYHKMLWTRVAEELENSERNIDQVKNDVFEQLFDRSIKNNCFACEVVNDATGLKALEGCASCPIADSIGVCNEEGSAYETGDAKRIRDAVWDWSKIPEEGRKKLGIKDGEGADADD